MPLWVCKELCCFRAWIRGYGEADQGCSSYSQEEIKTTSLDRLCFHRRILDHLPRAPFLLRYYICAYTDVLGVETSWMSDTTKVRTPRVKPKWWLGCVAVSTASDICTHDVASRIRRREYTQKATDKHPLK
jgi:hypothetical protein